MAKDCIESHYAVGATTGYCNKTKGGVSTTHHRWAYVEHHGLELADLKDLEVDHLCRNRICINPDHLEAVTRSENQRRAGSIRGERNPKAKLNEVAVRAIRQLKAEGVKRREIHRAYRSFNQTTIDNVLYGLSWKEVV